MKAIQSESILGCLLRILGQRQFHSLEGTIRMCEVDLWVKGLGPNPGPTLTVNPGEGLLSLNSLFVK